MTSISDDINDEKSYNERLSGKPSLTTFLRLSFGPLITQCSSSLSEFFSSFWVSRALGVSQLSAVALVSSFDEIGRAFDCLLMIGASSTISALIAVHKEKEAS